MHRGVVEGRPSSSLPAGNLVFQVFGVLMESPGKERPSEGQAKGAESSPYDFDLFPAGRGTQKPLVAGEVAITSFPAYKRYREVKMFTDR